MQEEVNEKTISLCIKGGKITAQILKAALIKLLAEMDKKKQQEKGKGQCKRTGKQSIKSLQKSGAQITNIVVTDNNIKSFDRVARKYGMDKNLVVSIHVQSVDQLKAIKLIKGKITDLDRMKIEEQKKAVRSGYDMEIIPSDLATYGGEAKKILDDLQSRNERMFLVTVLFLNTAKTKQELDSAVFQTAGIAQKFNCTLNRLDYLQEQGLMSSLPLANNLVPIKRAWKPILIRKKWSTSIKSSMSC